uniref:Uncharacterized protein n=1 Tax=Strongyloides stercoralis TaxID=6248 RepID=A0A0K0ETC9_STRER
MEVSKIDYDVDDFLQLNNENQDIEFLNERFNSLVNYESIEFESNSLDTKIKAIEVCFKTFDNLVCSSQNIDEQIDAFGEKIETQKNQLFKSIDNCKNCLNAAVSIFTSNYELSKNAIV